MPTSLTFSGGKLPKLPGPTCVPHTLASLTLSLYDVSNERSLAAARVVVHAANTAGAATLYRWVLDVHPRCQLCGVLTVHGLLLVCLPACQRRGFLRRRLLSRHTH